MTTPSKPKDDAVEQVARERIAQLAALEEGWNGYRAAPINPAVLERAIPFAHALAAAGHPQFICPLSDGGVDVSDNDTSIGFDLCPDGTVTLTLENLSDATALRLFTALSNKDDEAELMRVITKAIMFAEPVDGFPVGREELAAFKYGKDVALTAAREAIYLAMRGSVLGENRDD